MFQHPSQELIHMLSLWGYPTMLLLMIVEGPIVTIIAAFLATLGYFNVFAVFGLSVAGDVIGDVILYYIGYFGGNRILAKAERFLKISAATVEKLKNKFHKNSGKIVFLVKSTTGLSYITFITAGTLKMRFSKFVFYSILGGLVWSSFLVIAGYFFGYAADRISEYIKSAGAIILAAAAVFFIGIMLYRKSQAKKILK
ncbi:MAG: DedA family protein [Candidatus Moranbacteria bacterium]|nr:DedA family protein [Candidatus Moranbacteria bacterium]